ncbi:MAG: hypothetical protein NZ869_04600 [Thermoanaerobaculum sp.]|nr:hypothetical protein [Thermoanaerobaculum sp.]MCX7895696.1 hypothetical protein [Thermoanaerobaculum sp.]
MSQSQALGLLEQVHHEVQPLMERIVNHRFLAALEEGRPSRDVLKVLAAQQYKIVSHGLRDIALILSRFAQWPSRHRLRQLLEAEFEVREALLDFASELGLDEAALDQAPAILEAQIFSFFESHLALYGTDAELIAAFHFDAKVWIGNAARVARALRQHYGLSEKGTRFFDMYAAYLPKDEDTLPFIQNALARREPLGDCPTCRLDESAFGPLSEFAALRIRESVRLLLEAEWYFWEAMARAANL